MLFACRRFAAPFRAFHEDSSRPGKFPIQNCVQNAISIDFFAFHAACHTTFRSNLSTPFGELSCFRSVNCHVKPGSLFCVRSSREGTRYPRR